MRYGENVKEILANKRILDLFKRSTESLRSIPVLSRNTCFKKKKNTSYVRIRKCRLIMLERNVLFIKSKFEMY